MKSKSFLSSLGYAWQGLVYTVSTQRNMQIHLVVMVLVLATGVFFGLTSWEWAVLLLAIGLVLAAETVNTAIEAFTDLLSPGLHPAAAKAKNVAAGAVLITAVIAIVEGLIIFGRRIWG